MAGLFDKAKDFLGDEKRSDALLDQVAKAADTATGGKHTEQIRKGRDAADAKLGDEQGGNRP